MRIQFPKVPPLMVIGFIKDKDLRVLTLEENEIYIESDELIDDFSNVKLEIFNLNENKYNRFQLNGCEVIRVENQEFSYIYVIKILNGINEELKHHIQMIKLMAELPKENSSDSLQKRFSKLEFLKSIHTGYPYDKDSEVYKDYNEQMKEWFGFEIIEDQNNQYKKLMKNVKLAFSLNNHRQYKRFIENGIECSILDALSERNISNHGIFTHGFTRLYIGNEFCTHLLPECGELMKLLNKAVYENYEVTVVLSYITENQIENTRNLLNKLQQWCIEYDSELEIVVNDWAVAELVNEEFSKLKCIFGRLMNKRKKDPRAEMMFGYEKYKEKMKENNLNSDYYIGFLKNNNICRFEFEDTHIKSKIPVGTHSLHFPFYQINTSAFCPTYAENEFFSKYKQRSVSHCPHYCDEFCFLYPKHLDMIGKGNSIFGFSNKLFIDANYLKEYIEQGIDRIVFSAE